MGDKRFSGWRLPLRLACFVALCVSFGTGITRADAPPTCNDVAATANEVTAITIQLQCTDVDGDALSDSTVTTPADGTPGVSGSEGTVSSTPEPGYVGSDSFEYDASSISGLSNSQTVTINVVVPPSISLTTPADTDYPETNVPDAALACTAATGTSISSCAATADGSTIITDGAALPTTPGTHTVVVNAADADGGTASGPATYTVSAPPTAAITAPASGADYPASEVPAATFTCPPDPNSQPASCAASVDGAPLTNGAAMPTSVGSHTLTVVATDPDGLSSPMQTSTYGVNPPPVCQVASAATTEGHPASVELNCSDPNASPTT